MDTGEASIFSAAYYGHEVKDNDNDELHGSISQRKLLGIEKKMGSSNIPSPSAKFLQIAEKMDKISLPAPSSRGFLNKKINLRFFIGSCKEWIKDPFNMALLLWITGVAVSGGVLFLVMTGMLNNLLPTKSQRDAWFEFNNQILNALFTLMCLYHQPKRFHHLILLWRWKPEDVLMLRKVYCKNATRKPREWAHMMILLVLLYINSLAQYALCGLNLGFQKSERPAAGFAACLAVAISAAAGGGLYSIFSPLGKEYNRDDDDDDESSNQMERSRIVQKPQWRGGLFDLRDDINTACLSIFCSFCIFGYNMERLGFGNTYVQIATFAIFCTAPVLLFGLAAHVMDSSSAKLALSSSGILLSVLGLLYGGYWRIRMRKKFELPENNSCCGKANVTDCSQWLFCCCCAVAQEVRTANYYEIMEDKFCNKETDDNGRIQKLSPLPREGGKTVQFRSNPASPIWDDAKLSEIWTEKSSNPNKFIEISDRVGKFMKPPNQSAMERDGSRGQQSLVKENRDEHTCGEKATWMDEWTVIS